MDYPDKATEQAKAAITTAFQRQFTEAKKRDVAFTLTSLVGRPTVQLYAQRVLGRLSAQPQEIRLILRHEAPALAFRSILEVTEFLAKPSFEMREPRDSYLYEITYSDFFEFSRHAETLEQLSALHAQVHTLNEHLNRLIKGRPSHR